MTQRQARTLFRFDATMRFGGADAELLTQLLWQIGYPMHGYPELEAHGAASGVEARGRTGERHVEVLRRTLG